MKGNGIVKIDNCSFTNNECQGGMLIIEWIVEECLAGEENATQPAEYSINHCIFENNSALVLIGLKSITPTNIVLHIQKTLFINFKEYNHDPPWPSTAIIAENIKLYLSGMIIFNKVHVKYGLLHSNEDIFVSNNVTFSNIKALNLIKGK